MAVTCDAVVVNHSYRGWAILEWNGYLTLMLFLDGALQEIPSWIVEQEGEDLWSLSSYDLNALLDRFYDSALPPDTTTQPGSSRSTGQAESPSSESSSSTRQHALPLDEYLDFGSDSSDEEMEEIAPSNPSTTAATTTSELVRCLWQDCCAEFEVGTHYDVWKDHIKSAHVELQEEDGSRRLKVTKCRWNGCGKTFKQPQGVVKHMATHLRDIRRPCPLGCGKSFRAEEFTVTRHLRCCPLRRMRSTRN
ncbi:hypothetical protein BDM02DRAFT_3120917, partial [Thelephora ganbajun]